MQFAPTLPRRGLPDAALVAATGSFRRVDVVLPQEQNNAFRDHYLDVPVVPQPGGSRGKLWPGVCPSGWACG